MALNIKRVILKEVEDKADHDRQPSYMITDFQETKTAWHPVDI